MKKLITAAMITLTFAITGSINRTQAQTYYSFDFSGFGTFDFDYGSWSPPGNITPGPAYITVAGTSDNSGGAGKAFAPVDVTLTPLASTFLTVSARLLPTHAGGDLRISLSSSPLDYSVWAAPASLFNTTTFTTVQIPLSTTPVFTVGSLDLTAVTTMQIQGDFFSPGAFAIEIESISIIPEPQSVALLASALLLFGVLMRRMMRRSAKTAETT